MEHEEQSIMSPTNDGDAMIKDDEDSQQDDAESVANTMLLLDTKTTRRPSLKSSSESGKDNEDYVRKRARNNLAVKKSRDRSKKRILETQERVEQLTKENNELNQKVTLLSKELNVLRALFTNGGFTVPCNLQIVAQNPADNGNKTSSSLSNSVKSMTTMSLAKMTAEANKNSFNNHTSVIRSATSGSPCHGVILVTEPGKMNLDIQAGIQFKDDAN